MLFQILASMVKNALLLDLGMATAFSAIAIPALTGLDQNNNAAEFLRINESQASWLGNTFNAINQFNEL